MSKATRDKVMKAADELNFSISRSAAALKTGRALRIAVLISGRLNLWFSSSIMEGLNESFHDEGYDISIYQMSSAEERQATQVSRCANHRHQFELAGRARLQRRRAHR